MEVQFLSGRYHSTRWGTHVNEGQVEWPPFPWRILRTLISVWYQKCQNEVSVQEMDEIIKALQSELPSYLIPRSGAGHTRHWMPLGFKSKKIETTKIFDSFVAPSAPLYIIWPNVSLSEALTSSLKTIVNRISYLGRAESLAEVDLVDDAPSPNLTPVSDSDFDMQLLCPMQSEDYATWRKTFLSEKEEAILRKKSESGKKPSLTKRERERIESSAPLTVRGCMEMTTGDIRTGGWSQPPGALWEGYRFHGHADGIGRVDMPYPMSNLPTLARFRYVGPQPHSLRDSIMVSDSIHRALVRLSDGNPAFTGCDEQKQPLEGHSHAYVFCESLIEDKSGRRGEITHVNVFRSQGFGREEMMALQRLSHFWRQGNQRLLLISIGRHEDTVGQGGSPSFVGARTWVSRTPFLGTRHPKATRTGIPKVDQDGYQIGSPEHDLLRLLSLRNLPPARITRMEGVQIAGRMRRWSEFREKRRTSRRHPVRATGFMIEFEEPVRGPLLLGLEDHYGMGHFIGVEEDEQR